MLKTLMEKLLIVGNGMTGASIAALLRQDLKKSASILLWDKSNGTGMHTLYFTICSVFVLI